MTIYGPDISSFQHGVDVGALSDPFVILKCTEGTYYTDADYPRWLAQAKASKKLVIAYHFVRAGESVTAQAQWMAQHIIDKNIPVMLDVETEDSSNPDAVLIAQLADAMTAVGLRVKLAYLPRWYWQKIGQPSLLPLAQRGIGLVSSNYPSQGGQGAAVGYAASGGDTGPGWASYGGVGPLLWQYTDSGLEQQLLDFNAYRGTIDQLKAFLSGTAMSLGDDVTPEEHGWVNNLYAGVFFGGPSCGAPVPAGQPGAGSNSLFAHIGYVTALLEALNAKPAAPTLDPATVASQIVTAIEQHFASGVDVQAVAVAVQAQLAQALGSHGAG